MWLTVSRGHHSITFDKSRSVINISVKEILFFKWNTRNCLHVKWLRIKLLTGTFFFGRLVMADRGEKLVYGHDSQWKNKQTLLKGVVTSLFFDVLSFEINMKLTPTLY